MSSANTVLQVLASPRGEASVRHQLADKVIARLKHEDTQLITRDVSEGVPIVDGLGSARPLAAAAIDGLAA